MYFSRKTYPSNSFLDALNFFRFQIWVDDDTLLLPWNVYLYPLLLTCPYVIPTTTIFTRIFSRTGMFTSTGSTRSTRCIWGMSCSCPPTHHPCISTRDGRPVQGRSGTRTLCHGDICDGLLILLVFACFDGLGEGGRVHCSGVSKHVDKREFEKGRGCLLTSMNPCGSLRPPPYGGGVHVETELRNVCWLRRHFPPRYLHSVALGDERSQVSDGALSARMLTVKRTLIARPA